MYSRAYTEEEGKIKIPDNYGGTAIFDAPEPEAPKKPPEPRFAEPEKREIKIAKAPDSVEDDKCEDVMKKESDDGALASFFGKLTGADWFSRFPKPDWEDMLLVALAAFLFLSKNGDKECALALVILLFIR